MTISKRVILAAAFIAVVSLVLAPSAALAAGSRIVDDDYPSPAACRGAGYATIQDAIDSFASGQNGTIKVCAGAYTENVSMTGLGKIKLMGLPGATLTAPAEAPLIVATDTTRLTVQGFTLDEAGYASAGMLLFQNSSGVVTKNVFQNSPGGYGVAAKITSGKRTLKVTNNDFTSIGAGVYVASYGSALSAKVSGNDFTGAILGVTIAATAGGSATATVTGNRLQGTGSYGIQVYGINKARVSGNTVDGFALGVYLADSSLARVSKNKVRSTVYGIAIIASSANASSNKVQGNTLEAAADSFIGVYVAAGTSLAADFNQIKGNAITDPSSAYTGTIGIKLDNLGVSLNKTVIKSNKLINIDTLLDPNGDTNTVISGNKCTPGVCVI